MAAEEQVELSSFLETLQPNFKWHGRAENELEASLIDRTIWQEEIGRASCRERVYVLV